MTAVPPTHAPATLQVSVPLHGFVSAHEVPAAFATGAGHPVAGTHAPTVWQASAPGQVSGVPATQVPDALHISVPLHGFVSAHDVPAAFATGAGQPVAGTHAPTVWHPSAPAHVSGVPATHVPVALHVSVPLHRFVSAHDVPAAAFGLEQVPVLVSQTPAVWQASRAVQVTWSQGWATREMLNS
ncbi:MAG: hypothetical protein ABJA82_02935 [Myxococcales bacterium]